MPRLVVQPAHRIITVKKGAALVDVAEEHEIGLDFGCRDGVCGTCVVTVVRGSENLNPPDFKETDTLENFDAEPDQRLACQVKILGDVEIRIPSI